MRPSLRRRARGGVLAAVLALVVSPAALADGQQTMIPKAQAIAVAAMGNVCAGSVTIEHGELPQGVLAQAEWYEPDDASSPDTYYDCRVVLTPSHTWTWPWLCTAMVHEYGHLAGLQHSPDPNNVMYYQLAHVYPACAGLGHSDTVSRQGRHPRAAKRDTRDRRP